MHVVVRLPTLALSAYFLISPLRGQPAGERPSKSSSGAPTFLDIAASSGVDFKNEPSPTSQKYLPESMVGAWRCLTTTEMTFSISILSTGQA